MLTNLDTNITKWLYNIKDDAILPLSLNIPGNHSGVELIPGGFSKPGHAFLRKEEAEKFEDANYKDVIKKAAEKKLNK